MTELITDNFEFGIPETSGIPQAPTIESPVGPIDELDLPGLDQNPGVGAPKVQGPGPKKPLSFSQAISVLESDSRKRNPFYGTGFTEPNRVPLDQAKKYLDEDFGYMWGADNEDFYAQRQSTLEKVGSGLLKLPLYTVAKLGQGVGFVGSLFNPANMFSSDGYFASAADNGFSEVFKNMEDWSRDEFSWTKTFQETDDRNKGFWARAVSDIDFWTEDVVDGAAFLASAYLPGAALSKLGLGMKLARGLSKYGIGAETAGATIGGLEGAANYLNSAQRLAKTFDFGTTWALATASESMFEAKGVKDAVELALKDSDLPEDEKQRIIAGAARNTFLSNAALLGITNLFELKYLYKAFGKTTGLASDISQPGGLGSLFKGPLAPQGKLDKFLQSPTSSFIKGAGLGVLREGFVEENMQLAIQRMNEQYGAAGKVANFSDFDDLFKQYGKQTVGAVFGSSDDPENRETAMNIGIGGVLGGLPGGIGQIRQDKANRLTTESALQALNLSQQNWIKYGNIYKSETIETTDSKGNTVKQERLVLDEQNKPVVDDEKLNGITTGFRTNMQMVDAAEKESNLLRQRILRDTAFADFVSKHIDAGIEDTLLQKLEASAKAKPEDLINLGFDVTKDTEQQIRDYMGLASTIIKQNKLIKRDILFDSSVEDSARKTIIGDLAAKQAVYNKVASEVETEASELNDKISNKNNTSLSDSIVDQLNELQYRINSANEVIEEIKKSKQERPLLEGIQQQLISDLQSELNELVEENELTLKGVKKDKEGFYKYQKARRNNDPLVKIYKDKIKTKGEILNSATTAGFEIAKYADTKLGKSNFLAFVNEGIVKPVNDALDEAEKKKKIDEDAVKAVSQEEVTGRTATITYKDKDNNDQSLDITEGATYLKKNENNKTDRIKIVSISDDDKTITIALNKEDAVELDAARVAQVLKDEEWTELKPKVKKTSAGTAIDSTPSEEADTEISDDEKPDYSREKKPKFEEIGFNKTFGLQYLDPDDSIPNTESGTERFYQFTAKHNMANQGYALEVITKGNDRFGIRDEKYNPDDIKVVIVKKIQDNTTGETKYVYVDVNNQEIPAGQEDKNNIVYRSLMDRNKWDVDRIRKDYTVNPATSDEKLQETLDAHIEWQKDLEKRAGKEPVYLDVVTTSPGVQKIERTVAVDEDGKTMFAMADMEGRVISEDPDYSDLRSVINPEMNIGLRVATADGAIAPGILAGRIVMQEYKNNNGRKEYGDKLFRVFNRNFTEEEKDTIMNAFIRIGELFNKKYKLNPYTKKKRVVKLSEEEENELLLIQSYLKGVLNWKKPKAEKGGNKYFWIENGLHRGDKVIKLEKGVILKNRDALLKTAKHHVYTTYLGKNEPFVEIKFKQGKAEIGKKWASYEEYLIAKRDDGGVPPVYTSLPKYDSKTPQRSSVYVIWKDPAIAEPESSEEEDKEPLFDSVRFSKEDEEIDKLLSLRKRSIKIKGVSFSIEQSDEGYSIKYYNPKKNRGGKSVIYSTKDAIQKDRGVILQEIAKITGYKYGSLKSIRNKVIDTLRQRQKEEIEKKTAQNQAATQGPQTLEQYLQAEYNKLKTAAESQDQKIIPYDLWKVSAGKFAAKRYKGPQAAPAPAAPVSDTVTVYHHTSVKPKDFDFGSFKRGKQQVSQFGDGLNASSTTTSFLVQRYGQPIQGEVRDSDFIVIDANKTEKELYEELKGKGYKFNSPDRGSYTQNDPAKEYDGTEKANEQPAIISLFNDFQNSNPQVKGVKVVNHIIGGTSVDPFYVIYDSKSFYGPGSLSKNISVSDVETKLEEAPASTDKYYSIEEAVLNATPQNGKLSAEVYDKDSGKIIAQATISIPAANLNAGKYILRKMLGSQLNAGADEAPFRLALREEVEKTEDFSKLKAFLEEKLPQFSVKRMAHLIAGKAWGQFKNDALYIYERAEIGTGFHEAFEGVWMNYLTDAEQSQLIDEFRSRNGKFTNVFSGITKSYKDASIYDVREMLAEEFRDYVLNNKSSISPKTTNIFKKIWDFIKSLFGISSSERNELESKVNEVFSGIMAGKFANIKKIRENDRFKAPTYRAVTGLTQKETSEILEGVNYYFFTDLLSKGSNINAILYNLDKKESNSLLKANIESSLNKVLDNLKFVSPRVSSIISQNRTELYELFKKNLKRYGVNFENLEEASESNITDTLGIRDSITVDPRKSTSVNVMVLLASLPETTIENNKRKLVRNSLNQPKLVNPDKVHTILLNELSNTVGIINENGVRENQLDKMFSKLDDKYITSQGEYREGFGWIQNLKARLKYTDSTGNRVPSSTLTKDEMMLQVAFTKSFSNVRFQPDKLLVNDEGNIYSINPLMNINEDRIKSEWANNLKVQVLSGKNRLFKINKKGEMVVSKSSQDFFQLLDLLEDSRSNRFGMQEALYVLGKLGIRFSADASVLESKTPTIRTEAIQILNALEREDIKTVDDIYGNNVIGGRINTLLSVEAQYNTEDNILSYLNSDGEMQFAVGIPSLWGNMINTINSVKNLKELVLTCPWLGRVDESGNVVLNPYQTGSDLLKKGGLLFDKKGNRKSGADLSFRVISGTGISEVDGTNTAKLQLPERTAIKIHYLLNGIPFSVINSDKSTEYGIGMPGKNLIIQRADLEGFLAGTDTKIIDLYMTHLADEMHAAQVQAENPVNIQYYKDGVLKLGHFSDIISAKNISKFVDQVVEGDVNFEDFIEANKEALEKDISKYINSSINSTVDFLQKQDIFVKPASFTSDKFISNAIDNDLLNKLLGMENPPQIKYREGREYNERDGYTENQIKTIAGLLAINEDIYTTEQHKLIYGHPAIYKDLPKRANGSTSTKEAFVEDTDVIQWADNNMPRNDGKIRSAELSQTMNVISFGDVNVASLFYKEIAEKMFKQMLESNVTSEEAERSIGARFDSNGKLTGFILDRKNDFTGSVKAYMSLVEADAMAMGMPDLIRDMLFMSSKLTPEYEAQWDYEVAYEKLVRSGEIARADGKTVKKTDPIYKKYKPSELADALAIYQKGNPGHVFQVLKPQYFGYANTKDVTHTVFLKHALQPKFFRHVEGTQFEKMYVAAQKAQVDVIGFESGEKVGNVTKNDGKFVPVYKEDGSVNIDVKDGKFVLPSDLPVQTLYSRFYGIQVEQSNKPKNYVVRGTQVTKIIMTNFYENGLPLNAEVAELIESYNDTLNKMFKLGKQKLLVELGLERTEAGDYITKDLRNLVNLLREEAEARDMPDNMIDSINYLSDTQELEYFFDTLINRDKIDNILNSIVDSRVISEKMHGKSSPQVASTLYEANPRGFVYLKDGVYTQLQDPKKLTEEQKATIKMASNDLKFYRSENGAIQRMEVYISWPFKGISPEELGLKLVNGIYRIPDKGISGLDKSLLNIIGFRIPTQAPNSIESIVVKGFTPAENGDMIVVPSEIVGKAGSDFDIDKLNLYIPNYSIEGITYEGKEFLQFLEANLIENGATESFAKSVVKNLSTEDFALINQSTYTESGRSRYNAPSSLEAIKTLKDLNLKDLQSVKKSLTNFNSQYKGSKKVKYITPNDTTTEGLQNKLISIMSELVLRPENFAQLVAPNTTVTLKTLAERIKRTKIAAGTKNNEDEKSATYLRSFVGSVLTRERYLTSKRMVGISALHTTFHTIAQISGLRLTGIYKTSSINYLIEKKKRKKNRSKKEEIVAVVNREPIDIKLDHHPKLSDGTYAIGYRTDTSGRFISENNSESTSGFVDGAKDPFVFDLNLSLKSAGVWFYLQHMGVPVEQISYLFSQPIMDSYFEELNKRDSNFKKVNNDSLTREDLFYKVIAPYYNKLTGGDLLTLVTSIDGTAMEMGIKNGIVKRLNVLYNSYEKFDIEDLQQAVEDGSAADARLQIAVLMSYLRYEAQARSMTNFMLSLGYDTARTKTVQENMLQVSKWERSKTEGFIENPNSILENTFLGELKEQKEDIFNMFRNFFIALSPDLQEVFAPLYRKIDDPDVFLTKEDGINLVNRYQNHVLNYILHTTKTKSSEGIDTALNDMYQSMFFGEESLAAKLYDYKTSPDPEISENLIIKELLPMMSDNIKDTNNVKLLRQRLDTFEINSVIEALNDLRSYAQQTGDVVLDNFVLDLAKFSILQSGLNSSYMDYKKVLSTEVYSDLLKDVFQTFINSGSEIDVDQVWKTFHQNNWYNKGIVPKAPSWIKMKDGVLEISPLSSASKQDFYIKNMLNPNLTRDEIKTLKKEGRGYEAYVSILFQRTDQMGGKYGDKILYLPINKLGAGNRMVEIYTDPEQDSVIESNVVKLTLEAKPKKNGGWTKASDLFPELSKAEENENLEEDQTEEKDKDVKKEEVFKEDKPLNSIRKLIEESMQTGEDIRKVLDRKKEESKKCNKK